MADVPEISEEEEASFQEWLEGELLAKGAEIILHPLAGWAAATRPDNYVLLGVGYLTNAPTPGARVLRLVMTRDQATRLSQVLEKLARTPHVAPPEKPS